MDFLDALRDYQQADEDGVMVLVSRQACDEAIAEIERLRMQLAEAKASAVKFQRHRDAWRGFANGTRERPTDYLESKA